MRFRLLFRRQRGSGRYRLIPSCTPGQNYQSRYNQSFQNYPLTGIAGLIRLPNVMVPVIFYNLVQHITAGL